METVKQRNSCDCGIAAIATVLGATYEEVIKDFSTDFSQEGIDVDLMCQYIAGRGFSSIRKKVDYWLNTKFGREELFTPFAPIHVVHLIEKIDLKYSHVIIMDQDGSLFDVDEKTKDANALKDSYRILETIGFFDERDL